MNESRATLLGARKQYSHCAARLEKAIAQGGLTPVLSEQIIGVGVATDWVRRAAEMESITYLGKHLNRSRRRESFVELLRFNFAWSGLNAVFTRPALLSLLDKPTDNSEFAAFRVLFDRTPLRRSSEMVEELHKLLERATQARLPAQPLGTSVTTLTALNTKYLPRDAKGRTGKAIAEAAATGDPSPLGLPELVYAFRNWAVHGNALDGAFGTRPGFRSYVGTLLDVLAQVHLSTATALFAAFK